MKMHEMIAKTHEITRNGKSKYISMYKENMKKAEKNSIRYSQGYEEDPAAYQEYVAKSISPNGSRQGFEMLEAEP